MEGMQGQTIAVALLQGFRIEDFFLVFLLLFPIKRRVGGLNTHEGKKGRVWVCEIPTFLRT
jgi:hypothetical protein